MNLIIFTRKKFLIMMIKKQDSREVNFVKKVQIFKCQNVRFFEWRKG